MVEVPNSCSAFYRLAAPPWSWPKFQLLTGAWHNPSLADRQLRETARETALKFGQSELEDELGVRGKKVTGVRPGSVIVISPCDRPRGSA